MKIVDEFSRDAFRESERQEEIRKLQMIYKDKIRRAKSKEKKKELKKQLKNLIRKINKKYIDAGEDDKKALW